MYVPIMNNKYTLIQNTYPLTHQHTTVYFPGTSIKKTMLEKGQTIIYKILHGQLKMEQHEIH